MPQSQHPADIQLTLPAVPTSVAEVRVAVGSLAASLGLPEATIQDVRLAVTEVAANAVRHAYEPGRGGAFEVEARAADGVFEVVVRDRGRGVAIATEVGTNDGLGIGMGFPLMRTLAHDVTIEPTPGGGCTVRLRFPLSA